MPFPPLPPPPAPPAIADVKSGGGDVQQKSWKDGGSDWKWRVKQAVTKWHGLRECYHCKKMSYVNWVHGCRTDGCKSHPTTRWEAFAQKHGVAWVYDDQYAQKNQPEPDAKPDDAAGVGPVGDKPGDEKP